MRIEFLDKEIADSVLPKLFDILHLNMSRIAPTGKSYDEDLPTWLSCVRPALEKEPRQILLLLDTDRIAGFFQYYVNNGVFMMEEIQFRPEYVGSVIFAELYRYLVTVIPGETQYVEAYASKENEKSIAILGHLGLKCDGVDESNTLFHFRGNYDTLVRRYGNET